MLENKELERDNVVGVHPVLSGLTNKGTLRATSARVTSDRIATRVNNVKHARELDDERIIVLLVEGTCAQIVLHKLLAQKTVRLLVMLLHDLEETSVVQLCEQSQIVNIGNHVGEVLLQVLESFFKVVGLFAV